MAPRAIFDRTRAFMDAYRLRIPVLLAPMAGACPPGLSVAVGRAGGMGACGALLMQPTEIAAWAQEVSAGTDGAFQMNLWIPDPPPARDPSAEAAVRAFLGQWGPEVPADAGDGAPLNFAAQRQALLDARPAAISSIMGVYPADFIAAMKARGIRWFATATTVEEARVAERAGADVIVAQGMEAGGHRGAFEVASAEAAMVGLFALLPAIVDAVSVPVVATGGIADARGVAAALLLGASAVQIGTGFLRSPEAALPSAWADAIGRTLPEHTLITRAFSGRPGRSVATRYARAAAAPETPPPAPYPVQRGLTQPMRSAGMRADDIDRIQAWAGQSAALARAVPAEEIAREVWEEARAMLGGDELLH
ncbi:nitronate monooxygenase [Constrictibacter sp. MBR-5]|uniref:NAD(P)H-dependent flavin oxidoreductase n=1 Tax=Constrictibacter sp. MBR-5 TaxID=3156467 RepID=UPI003390C098